MASPQIRLKTQGFRAISNADIIIDGITVVAGENGSGKSTLSKLLYYLFKTASNYDALVYNSLGEKLKDVSKFLEIAIMEINPFLRRREMHDDLRKELSDLKRSSAENMAEQEVDRWINLIRKTSGSFQLPTGTLFEKERNSSRLRRLKFIARDILGSSDAEMQEGDSLPFEEIMEFVSSSFKEAAGKIKNRPNSVFIEALRNIFASGKLPDLFEVYEFEDKIASMVMDSLKIPYSIQNAIYIDTPMIVGVATFQVDHWNDLNNLLKKKGKTSFTEISQISSEIISGDVSLNESNSLSVNDFSFNRSDGSVYNLLDCATGVKSFAILQLLLKNGSLNDKTLLIIDEPESHLHPQWIIEYARLIVLLNKNAGVKFFIASHNPDMVSSIKFISMKEGVGDKLNYYLAEQIDKSYLYNYRHLKAEIDPIFASFNIALERMNKYGI